MSVERSAHSSYLLNPVLIQRRRPDELSGRWENRSAVLHACLDVVQMALKAAKPTVRMRKINKYGRL